MFLSELQMAGDFVDFVCVVDSPCMANVDAALVSISLHSSAREKRASAPTPLSGAMAGREQSESWRPFTPSPGASPCPFPLPLTPTSFAITYPGTPPPPPPPPTHTHTQSDIPPLPLIKSSPRMRACPCESQPYSCSLTRHHEIGRDGSQTAKS